MRPRRPERARRRRLEVRHDETDTPLSLRTHAIAAVACALRARGSGPGGIEDTKAGYKIKVPDKWACVPPASGSAGSPPSTSPTAPCSPSRGMFMGMEQKPQMRVHRLLGRGAEVQAGGGEDGRGDSRTKPRLQGRRGPLQGLQGLHEAERPGRRLLSSTRRKRRSSARSPSLQYEMKFEKLTVPRRAVTWVFRGDAAGLRGRVRGARGRWEKFQPVFVGCLQSFKLIKRDASNVSVGGMRRHDGIGRRHSRTRGGQARGVEGALGEGARRPQEERRGEPVQRAREKIPQGWTVKNSKNFLVISHTDQKSTDRIVEAAEAAAPGWTRRSAQAATTTNTPAGRHPRVRRLRRVSRLLSREAATRRTRMREIVTFKDTNMGTRRWAGFDRIYTDIPPAISSRTRILNLLFYARRSGSLRLSARP